MHLRSVTAVILTVALVAMGVGSVAGAGLGKYHDVDRAIADGYLPTEDCVPGMGFHYVNPALVDGDVKTSEPEALIYAHDSEGELELVGVEYLATQEFELLGDHAHFNAHVGLYALHAWYFLPNPDGLTADFNSRIDATCSID